MTQETMPQHNELGGDNHWPELDGDFGAADRGDVIDDVETTDPVGATADPADADPAPDAPGGDGGRSEDSEPGEPGEQGDPEPENDQQPSDQPEAGQADPQADPGAAKPAEPVVADDNPVVPRQRLNQEIAKRRELEARLAALEAQSQSAATPHPDAAPAAAAPVVGEDVAAKLTDAVLDGDAGKTAAVLAELLGANQPAPQAPAFDENQFEARVNEAIHRRELAAELRTTADAVAKRYPELDQSSSQLDEGLLEDVIGLRDTLAARTTPAKALEQAVALVAMEHGLVDRTAKAAEPVSDKPRDESGRFIKSKPVDMADKVKQAAKEKGKLGGERMADKPKLRSVNEYSDAEFGELPEDKLAKLRGDVL